MLECIKERFLRSGTFLQGLRRRRRKKKKKKLRIIMCFFSRTKFIVPQKFYVIIIEEISLK